MSDERNDPLHLLPLPSDLARERDQRERLAQQPRQIQDWYDATSDDPQADARLATWIDALLPPDEALVRDPEMDRSDAAEQRLSNAPRAVAEWFDATGDLPEEDAQLRAYVDRLAPALAAPAQQPALSQTPAPQLPDQQPPALHLLPRRRWTTWAVAAGAALAAGGLVAILMQDDLPGSQPVATVAPGAAVATTASPAPAPAPAVETVGAPQPATVTEPSLEVVADAAVAAPSPTTAPVTGTSAAPSLVTPPVATETLARIQPPVTRPNAAAELSPTPVPAAVPLASSGEITAEQTAWRGQVVPGLDLRLDAGYGTLFGTENSPQLALANDGRVQVDIDRALVDEDFATFTITTISGAVRVVGTRYTVSTIGGRTEVATRRGVVQVECANGRRRLVSKGQTASCDAVPDPRLLVHMQALDRPDQNALNAAEQYAHLQGQRRTSSPASFVATADVMLGRALADEQLRQVIEAVRIDAMCELGWEGAAQRAAQDSLDAGHAVAVDHLSTVAAQGCTDS